jgi:hypothetical protein
MNHVIVVPKHVEPMPSEDGQLTETCKGSKYIQIESHWMLLTIIILYNLCLSNYNTVSVISQTRNQHDAVLATCFVPVSCLAYS